MKLWSPFALALSAHVLAACSSSAEPSSAEGGAGSPSSSGASASSSGSGSSGSSGAGPGSSGSSSGAGAAHDAGSSSAGGSGSSSGMPGSSSSGSGGKAGSDSSGSGGNTGSGDAGGDAGLRDSGPAQGDGSSSGTPESGADGGAGAWTPCPATGDCKILPLGDSITFGTPTNNGGYRVELFSRAVGGGKHVTFVGSQSDGPNTVAGMPFPKANEGHPGWTIQQINGISTPMMALGPMPQVVLLHIGTNDMPAMSAGAPDRLGQLIDKIVAALPNALLVVSSIIPFPAEATNVTTYNAAVPGVVQQRAAQGKHVMFVDMNKGFPSGGLGSDGIHPNDNIGYPFMGDTWYTAIEGYLN